MWCPPLAHCLQHDGVPNVRFNAAKVLERIIPLLDASLVDAQIKPCLAALLADDDGDVRFFAARASTFCDGAAAMS